MSDFFNFILYTVQSIVNLLFSLSLGLGFTVGDLLVALAVIGVISSALLLRAKRA